MPNQLRDRSSSGVKQPVKTTGRVRLITCLLFFLCLLLAVAGRTVTHYRTIFPSSDDVRLLGNDPYYHLRHTRFTADNFPKLMRADVGTHYPTGLRDDAAGLFNISLAAVAIIVSGGEPSDVVLSSVLAWSPVVLFVFMCCALFWLTSMLLGHREALLCCALYILFPGESLERTTLGFGDYHVAEMLLALLTAIGLLKCLQRGHSPPAPPWWQPAFLYTLPMLLFLFTWRGAPIYVPICACSFLAIAISDIRHQVDWKLTAVASIRYGASLLILYCSIALLFPSLVITPRFFWINIYGCVSIMLAPTACLYLANVVLRNRINPSHAAIALCILIVSASLSIAFSYFPQARITLVNENRPVNWELVWMTLGPVAIMAIIAVPYILITSWQRVVACQGLVPLVFAGSMGLLWTRTNDFGYIIPPFAALLATLLVVGLARWLRSRLGKWELRVISLAFVVSLVMQIWPLSSVRLPYYVHRPEMMLVNDGWIQAMRWLRDETPKPTITPTSLVEAWETETGFEYPPDTYGVLCVWARGNFISSLGQRIPLSSRFPIKRTAKLLFGAAVPEASNDLCPECKGSEAVRYIIIDAPTVSEYYPIESHLAGETISFEVEKIWNLDGKKLPRAVFGEKYRQSLAVRLYLDDGKQLGNYRLVYESPSEHCLAYLSGWQGVQRKSVHIESASHRERALKWIGEGSVFPSPEGFMYDPVLVPSVKIFEHVNGAHITGVTSNSSKIEARLKLKVETTGRSILYIQSTDVDEQGRFQLNLPYPTGPVSPTSVVVAEGSYQLRLKNESNNKMEEISLDLTENQVTQGKRIDLGPIN